MKKEKILKTREQVIQMTCDEIAAFVRNNRRAWIVRGDCSRCECSPSGLQCEHFPNGFTDIEKIIEISRAKTTQ